jgi:hypothetical protein
VSISVNAGSYVDVAGNAGTGATLTTLSIDTQAPSLAITSNFESLKAGETATITFRFSEAPINFDENDVVVSGGELSTPIASESDPKIYTATFTPTAGSESTASISVGAGTYVDAAGNAGTAATLTTLSIDTQAPSLAITSNFESLKAGETATITFRFSEAPINFDENDVAVSGGELSTPIASESDSKVYTATFTPTAGSETIASISVGAGSYVDAAGNAGTAATLTTLSIDTQAPSLAITSNFESLKAGETATITFRFSEAPINFDENDVAVSGGELSTPIASESDPKIYTGTFTPTTNSEISVSISVNAGSYGDAAGNAGVGVSLSLAIDTAVPNTPSLILNQDTGVSATDHITSDTTLLIQNLEIGARWEYRFGASSSWIVGGVAQTSESRINLAANQVYAIGAIHVRQTDTVGNISAIGQNSLGTLRRRRIY